MTAEISVKNFKRNKISSAVKLSLSLLAMGAISSGPSIFAQEAEDADAIEGVEEVVVTGQRRSLQNAQDIKQFSEVVVDSISADDIGALPDRSVTESLQRVPGVAINRFAGSDDPDHFSAEGSGVVVRGLTYVRSELNGRDSFTANNGRGLSFADVPAELLGGVDVFKSPTADRIEGGIAGTVNLRTRLPFDNSENSIAFSLENNYGDFSGESAPTGSVLGTYRWDTNAGEFGVLGSAVYSQLKTRADRFQIANFAERDLFSNGGVVDTGNGETIVDTVLFPRGGAAGSQVFDRERIGFSGAAQWRSPDESMEATFQFLRSDSREAWTERTTEIATDVVAGQGDSFRVAGTELEFTDSGVFDSGVITGNTGWRDDQWSGAARTPVNALQSNNIRRDVDQKFVTEDISAKFEWNVNDSLAVSIDVQHVDSTVDNVDVSSFFSSYQDAIIDLNGTDIPSISFQPPTPLPGCADGSETPNNCPAYFANPSYLDPSNTFYRAAMDHIEESEGTSDSFRFDADWDLTAGSDWLSNFRVGYRHADRDQTARFSTYNWNDISEQWGNGGPIWLDREIDGVPGVDPAGGNQLPAGGFEVFDFNNFLNGNATSPLGEGRLFSAINGAQDYDAFTEYYRLLVAEWGDGGGWRPLAERDGVVAGTPFLPGEINPVEEINDAVYFTLRFGNELDNGWDLSGNVGLRYTKTQRTASGVQTFRNETFTTDQGCADAEAMGQTASPFCALDPSIRAEARAFSNGAETPFDATLTYSYALPSINTKLQVADGVQFRAAYFKGVSAPDFGLTRAFYNVDLEVSQVDIDAGNGRPIARFNAGNPFLEPVESDNYDLTAEWYFNDVGQLSAALFYKELDGIRTNDVRREQLTNNGVTFDSIITTPVNSTETGRISGFELAYQQTYDMLPGLWSGLGLAANYTNTSSSNVPQSVLSESDPDVSAGNQSTVDLDTLPLEGLSEHTLNIAPFYEYGPWSLRAAYSWRSDFLLTIRDVIAPFQPIINESTGQLDASVFYSINDNFKIGIQGVNLTEEILRTSAVIDDNGRKVPRSWYISDARYILSLRGKF